MSNPDLRPTHVLELLATLQKTAAAFAAREEALSRDFAARRHTVNRQQRDGLDKAEARLTSLIEESNALCQTGRQHLTALYEGRRMRINRVGTAALRKLPMHARQARERWMGDLQLKQFQSEKKAGGRQKGGGQDSRCLHRPARRRAGGDEEDATEGAPGFRRVF
ncbi:MAG: hypothetical protein WDN28_05280 [Chthoniobacter sp.]